MHIHKITLENFRGFLGMHEITFNKGINFFVGNNNCGKTTIFKAVEFILSKGEKASFVHKNCDNNQDVSVEIEFRGDDIKRLCEHGNLKKYMGYIIDNADGSISLRILRSSKLDNITQDKKNKSLDIKNVRIFNPNTNQFENPTGIDTTISELFDAQFVYSDLKNEDYQDFGKTKLVGKIINSITKNFQETDVFRELKEAHNKAFGDEGLIQILENIQNKIQSVLVSQYGDAEVEFNFGLPEIDNFLKNGNIMLSDNGIKTNVSEKGTGMQRALALSLIQVYAEINRESSDDKIEKPILFFIDEPETFLHPGAQNKLLNALERLSDNSQIFITTHSPYLLKNFDKDKHQIYIFSKNELTNKIDKKEILKLFGNSSPTWGEINYYAFGVISAEFHNELYGFLQSIAINDDDRNYYEENFDNWLANKGIQQTKQYNRINRNGTVRQENKTLPTFIRNIIHHPENTQNQFSYEELGTSIENLICVLNQLLDGQIERI